MKFIKLSQIKNATFYFRGERYSLNDLSRNGGYFTKTICDAWLKINLETVLLVKFSKEGLRLTISSLD